MITNISVSDFRFPLGPGVGSDAIHKNPIYAYAALHLHCDSGYSGTGIAFTLGQGNELVCKAAQFLAEDLQGKDIEELMADFGSWQRKASNEQQFRWLGPHKGVVQLALAAVTNACWDLWAKKRGLPLWKLLLELRPEQLVATLDLSYLEESLTVEDALQILEKASLTRAKRNAILKSGYPGYDTSIGWFNYSDQQVAENVRRSADQGFNAMKLKIGDPDIEKDLRRVELVRENAGLGACVMVDCNQQWTVPQALEFCERAKNLNLYWIEEPTHPDDVLGHAKLAKAYGDTLLAAGEHVPNRVVFHSYFQAQAMGICQVDAVRVAGISEFLAVSLLSRKFGVSVVPHVGDMGQIHQHLVVFNHIGMGHEALMLEQIPHLTGKFLHPCIIQDGVYQIPQEPGISADFI